MPPSSVTQFVSIAFQSVMFDSHTEGEGAQILAEIQRVQDPQGFRANREMERIPLRMQDTQIPGIWDLGALFRCLSCQLIRYCST
jgi:hypothetical protein